MFTQAEFVNSPDITAYSHLAGEAVNPLTPAWYKQEIKTFKVDCYPLIDILEAADLTQLDLLSLDVQGADLKILQTLPWNDVEIKVASELLYLSGWSKLTLHPSTGYLGWKWSLWSKRKNKVCWADCSVWCCIAVQRLRKSWRNRPGSSLCASGVFVEWSGLAMSWSICVLWAWLHESRQEYTHRWKFRQ